MLAVHTCGRAIVALQPETDAAWVAAIVTEARGLGYPLVCLALDT